MTEGWQVASNAVAIWGAGASNPRGIARALVQAIDYASESGSDGCRGENAAPARLILAHLAKLMGTGFSRRRALDDLKTCQRMAEEAPLKQ